jgi:hypothetical protein
MANPTALSMKLLIDRKAQRVLFAEASKDVVDFLFSFLALPVATAIALVEPGPLAIHMAGSLRNLYTSAEELGSAYLRPSAVKDELLPRPTGTSSSLLLMPASSFEPSRVFFRCQHNYSSIGKRGGRICSFYMTDVKGTRCPNCNNEMNETLRYVSPAWPNRFNQGGNAQSTSTEGSTTQAAATYTVMDDLTITPHTPMSAMSTIAMLGTLGVTDLSAVQEKTVQLGYNEVRGVLIVCSSAHIARSGCETLVV